jgi:hypothetical protein
VYGSKTKTLEYLLRVLNSPERTSEPPSWSELLQVSQEEGLTCILYDKLQKEGVGIPSPFKEKLRQEYIYNWTRNGRIFEELTALLPALESPVVLLKGASLLVSTYRDIGPRCLGDVDVLVRVTDIPHIDKILLQLGYHPNLRLNSYPISNQLNSLLYTKKDSPLILHLHWHLVNTATPNYVYAGKIDIEQIWKDALPLKLGKAKALCLSPHHQLLHLAEHAMKHSFTPLPLLWDIHLFISSCKEELHWDALQTKAKDFHLCGPLFYSLWLSQRFFNTSVPEGFLDSLRPAHPGPGERLFFSLIKADVRRDGQNWLFYLSNIPTWKETLKFIFHTFFPPRGTLELVGGLEKRPLASLYWAVLVRRLQNGLRLISPKYQ